MDIDRTTNIDWDQVHAAYTSFPTIFDAMKKIKALEERVKQQDDQLKDVHKQLYKLQYNKK